MSFRSQSPENAYSHVRRVDTPAQDLVARYLKEAEAHTVGIAKQSISKEIN